MNKSKTFCVLPWTHMATWTDGSALLCCVAKNSNKLNLNDKTVSEIWNSNHFKDARLKMLNGEKVSACDHCYKEEAVGIRSHRINENNLWTKKLGQEKINSLISATKDDGTLDEDLITLDFRLGNTCNLQCVMCRPQDSSMWLKNAKKLSEMLTTEAKWDWKHKADIDTGLFDWYKNENLWNDFSSMFPNIRHIIFAGGEPLLIKEHLKVIKKLVESGYSKDIELRYHTNGTTLSEEIIDLWKEFKYVELMVSVDAWGKHHDYVRYPADWNKILTNLKRLDETPDNIDAKILTTIHAMNVYYIPDFAIKLLEQNFKKIGRLHHDGLFHPGTVHWPRYLCTQIFPDEIKDQIKTKWNSYTELKGIKQWDEKIMQQMNFMDAEPFNPDLFDQFHDYMRKLDQIRNTSFDETFPEFAEILQ